MSPIIEQLAKEITFAQLEELIAHALVNQSVQWFTDNDISFDAGMVESNAIDDIEFLSTDTTVTNHIKHICSTKGFKQ
jgi:hypothetical protein